MINKIYENKAAVLEIYLEQKIHKDTLSMLKVK